MRSYTASECHGGVSTYVCVAAMSKQCLVVLQLSVEAGSWQDPDDALGLAHFIEHMLFMGTHSHPTPGGSLKLAQLPILAHQSSCRWIRCLARLHRCPNVKCTNRSPKNNLCLCCSSRALPRGSTTQLMNLKFADEFMRAGTLKVC